MTVTVDTAPAHTISIVQGDDVAVTVTDTPATVTIDLTPSPALVVQQTPAHQVTVATTGLQGAQGPRGPAGAPGGSYFLYDRAGVPAATWTITHNLNRPVSVTVVGDDGRVVLSDTDQADPNTLVITFAVPFSGRAFVG